MAIPSRGPRSKPEPNAVTWCRLLPQHLDHGTNTMAVLIMLTRPLPLQWLPSFSLIINFASLRQICSIFRVPIIKFLRILKTNKYDLEESLPIKTWYMKDGRVKDNKQREIINGKKKGSMFTLLIHWVYDSGAKCAIPSHPSTEGCPFCLFGFWWVWDKLHYVVMNGLFSKNDTPE